MDNCISSFLYLILLSNLIVFVVRGQPGGTPTFLDLFDGNFLMPGGIDDVPTANFDDPNLSENFLQFIDSIPNNLEDWVPARCQVPVEAGTCDGRSLRWAFDMESRRCRPFYYSGCNGNQNNFRTRVSCEISCPTRCSQNIDVGTCNENLQRWGFNDFTGRCQAFTFGGCGGNTNSFVSERDCVDTCGDVCLLPILSGPCDCHFPRWGYNFITGQCQLFYYGGCDGNRNRYLSREVCERACVRDAFPECPAIDPSLISVGPFGVGCNNLIQQMPCPTEGCPDGFACCESGCGSMCVQLENPPPPSPCSQMIDIGTCDEEIPRFGFNAVMGTCELFTYTGCGGNTNNFQTFSECIAACVPDICNEPVDRGPCSQNIIRWAYDSSAMNCTAFSYGGCGGNENNFVSPAQCFATCFRDLPQVDVCEQPVDEGFCTGDVARFAFNADVGFCLPLSYGGCGGNENNFATLLECDARCPPSIPASVCFLPLDGGPCLGSILSWGFDSVAEECVQFTYGGCDGNGNRFLTQTTCELRCLGQSQNLCPDGNPPCEVDPCITATCPANPAALCTSDLCAADRQCVSLFVDFTGNPVNCDVVIDVCLQPIVAGPCFLVFYRWGYNPLTNQCERFAYSGCLGNQNNFDAYAGCAAQCIGVAAVDVCTQPIAIGTCTNFIGLWGFNAQTQECQLFTYSGCGGNGNSFITQDDCISTCQPIDVCSLPVDPGPCAQQIQRFAFNPVTGQCELFIFGGCLGNANNFETQFDCVQRCGGDLPICSQPILPGPCIGAVSSWGFNAVTGNCEFFLASLCPGSQNLFQSFADCAQECNAPVDRCAQPIQVGDCTDSITRWGFNSVTRQCEAFVYSGCGGNGNSFNSREECEAVCDILPVVEDPCALPLDSGPCDQNLGRFGYNPATGSCQVFSFGGCEGNANNFLTVNECLDRCVADVCSQEITNCPGVDTRWAYDASQQACVSFSYSGCQPSGNFFISQESCQLRCEARPCRQAIVTGSCTASLTRFGFNSVTGQCQEYTYSGCGGTANRFNSLAECQQICEAGICLQPEDPGPCLASFQQFSYNSQIGACQEFTYGGCLGNFNRFDTLTSCTSACVVGTGDPCTLQIDPGICDENLMRFAFNPLTGACQSFTYGGCGGNINNFLSLEECNQRCVADVCSQARVLCPGAQVRWGYDPTQGVCAPFPYDGCTASGNIFLSQADCQQRCEVPVCIQAISPGTCSASLTRFGYNFLTGQCQSFTYSGCGGTANRFNSLVECQQNCEVDICARPIDVGPCAENQVTFGFNSASGTCESFFYGGCLGNENVFLSSATCQTRCNVDLCSLPLDSGSCNTVSTVFGYNSVTGQCEQFFYNGCLGNSNRFATLADCEARCEANICNQPQDPGPCSADLVRFSFNVLSANCEQFSYGGCLGGGNSFVSLVACQGACVDQTTGDACTLAADPGPCNENLQRFAYNPQTETCELFTYGGCLGNSNNFLTMDECSQRCITDVCAQPLVTCPGSTVQRWRYDAAQSMCVPIVFNTELCTPNGNFFLSQAECQQRCEVPICSQAIVPGSCSATLQRFAYNIQTGLCQSFTYSGCGGTANRFNSLVECQQNCEADPCAQPLVSGPCSAAQDRFRFNPLTVSCETFTFGGCLGNENLFLSPAECQLQCTTPVCSQAISIGNCFSSLQRFGYNAVTGQCEEFFYSGCGGSANRFNSLIECQQRCEEDACTLPIVPGPCSLTIPSFAFNTQTGMCQSFNYGGCLGNENIFATSENCQSRCIVDLCSLPLDSGSCTSNTIVWGFNTLTGLCQDFTYGGCLGNANRFSQQADCQARCEVNICLQPQDTGPCSAALQSFSYNSLTNACEQFTYRGCLGGGNRFDTLNMCQEACVVDDTGDVCSQLVDPGSQDCTDTLIRVFYNSILEACQSFAYTGCGGNSNNFLTSEACTQRCVTDVCAQPLPNCPGAVTRWGYDANQGACVSFTYNGCQDSGNLFTSQEACQQRCEVPVCSQATDPGPCTNQLPRFSFDAVTGQCQPLDYSGCGGTANRFNTLQECQQYCQVDICAQTFDAGPCSVPNPAFMFNPVTGVCDFFTYGGCLGSANRFQTFDECQSRCQVDLCSLPLEMGPCDSMSFPWGFNAVSGACEQFPYGGCLGNANRFSSQAACAARCEVNVCLQPEDPGPCSVANVAFSFNSNTGTCGQFFYGGCLGGGNRFDSLTNCQATCEVPVGDPCTQIIDDGLCNDNVQRFAYNAQTLSCESFQYTGCGGNSNNFFTATACTQRCLVDICAQPMASCAGTNTRWSYNAATGTCESSLTGDCRIQTGNFFESEAECQQRCLEPICRQTIQTGSCTGVFGRFAFNTFTGMCQSFIYTGCGGNANNFMTQEDCRQSCEVDICGRPQDSGPCSAVLSRIAFDDESGQCVSLNYGGCLGSSNRFTSLGECQQRCLEDVCALPMAAGDCGQAVNSWWYNQVTGACEEFVYTGCEGNANRFASQTACMQRCIDEICTQPLDAGVCQAAIPRIRFNSGTGQCESFTYSGCFGSANSFVSTTACENRCLTNVCGLPLDSGPCSGSDIVFGYNVNTGSCQSFTYGGCLGNPNRFSVQADCQARCEVTNICNEISDPGPCGNLVEQVFFNPTSSQCETFLYGGCLGGRNRFATAADCATACEVGVTPSCPIPMQDGDICGFFFCAVDSNCNTGQMCCPNGCATGMQCLESVFVVVNPGSCPDIPTEDPAVCSFLCQEDSNCGQTMKCCYTGCGTACMDPV